MDILDIALINTGGTIAADLNGQDILDAGNSDGVAQIVQQVAKQYNISNITVYTPFTKLSENMTPDDWVIIAQAVHEAIKNDVDGVLITHGTDTLVYSASALSFLIQRIPIPVAFTGALTPADQDESDAPGNLKASLCFLSKTELTGSFIVFRGEKGSIHKITYAPYTREMNTHGTTYKTAAPMPIGVIENNKITYHNTLNLPYSESPTVKKKVCSDHVLWQFHPGFDPDAQAKTALDHDKKAVIIDPYHSRTLNVADLRVGSAINKLVCNDIAVVGLGGISRYQSVKEAKKSGLKLLGPLTAQAALTKSSVVLPDTNTSRGYVERMRLPIVNEFYPHKEDEKTQAKA